MKIVDASVALKWFVVESFGQDSADEILREVESAPHLFAVPELFFAEMLHVLGKIFKDAGKVKESLAILESLGFERIGLGHELLSQAAEISAKYGIGGYDAIYVASAHLLGGHWYTFDQEAHRKLAPLKRSILLR